MNGNSITSATSLPFTTGSGAGNDFTVNTSHLVIEGDTGQVGIGIVDPVSPFYVYESTANVDATAGATINNASTGDSLLQFLLDATQRWVVGVDNSDSDKFKIASTADLDSDAVLSIDPTSGAMSLLRSSLVYSGAARATRKVTLVPEFSGATMTGDGAANSGIMISDFCSNTIGGVPDTNTTVCNTATTDIHNYYSWDQSGGSAADYDIWIRWRVPDNFSAWAASNPIYVYGKRTDATNNSVLVYVYDTAGVLENAGGTEVAGTIWTQTSIEASFAGTYTAGSYMTIQIHMVSDTGGDTVQVGEISLDYLSNN
ncbi:hypothetical protein KAI54_03260 [Candidatus Gracilibacteria bacterium]|nr:hypothetical protein [Candidatus Gracilibacteria bacterium]